MASPEINLNEYTIRQLMDLRAAIQQEIDRQKAVTTAAEKVDKIAKEYKAAMGFTNGDQWEQPNGAYDAYPLGARVTHDGKLWESTIPANVWAPGVSGWREVSTDPDIVPNWVRPTGAHDAYQEGDRVTFEGGVYESTINNNVWTPVAYPAGWVVVTAPPAVEPEPGEPVEWVQPAGAHDAYDTGDRVLFEGEVYESTVDENVYSPTAYPAGWNVIVDPPVAPEPEPEPEPEEPPAEPPVEPEPEPEPEPAPADWVQPTGGHDAYNIGDLVTFEGAVYSSKINANTYSPTAYPAGWELVP